MKVKIPDSRVLATIDEIRNPVVPLDISACAGCDKAAEDKARPDNLRT